eukprot:CAMPEP_0194775000 /NCGR_PEP_ID=MMETSP0323_2-20130528/59157_1 /TAXON_ID=2866 ORGANISM="Crypthecodinium cohnii, Strain Seligo" /NCGR_SAMPLE_ID=MMETSP0323_2 /ASSEMBLY_ACC=CAM_ASM_000346 /LENGTH=113 /DNA_ID=CAMNT_0039710803 /DNA_START=142 /DNA_END=479 /DNA_ORIENTATION=-
MNGHTTFCHFKALMKLRLKCLKCLIILVVACVPQRDKAVVGQPRTTTHYTSSTGRSKYSSSVKAYLNMSKSQFLFTACRFGATTVAFGALPVAAGAVVAAAGLGSFAPPPASS